MISQHFGTTDTRSKPTQMGGYQLRKPGHRPHVSQSGSNHQPQAVSHPMSSCGPSTDEICCIMDLSKGDIEESSSQFVWK
jgi:hypothetical protein